MNAWLQTMDHVPSTYLSFIVLPLLPWLQWGVMRAWRQFASLAVAGLTFALIALGPEQLWLFRWPIRLVEHLYVAAAVLLAVLLSAGLATTHRSRWLALSGIAILASLAMGISAAPDDMRFHVLAAIVATGALALAVVTVPRWGMSALLAATLLGTAVLAPAQGIKFGWHDLQASRDVDLPVPSDIEMLSERTTAFRGTVLQVAGPWGLPADTTATADGELIFGNLPIAAGVTGINGYTGIMFRSLRDALGVDYRGAIKQEVSLRVLVQPLGDGYSAPLVDALGVSTLVLDSNRVGARNLVDRLPGWSVAEDGESRIVLTRDTELDRVHLTTRGVEASVSEETGANLVVSVNSESGGRILVDRLAWNGYTATLNGEKLTVTSGPAGLLEIVVPEGSGEIVVTYTIPNLALGTLLSTIGGVGGIALIVLDRRSRRLLP
jgi:hypothetical protein